MYGVNLAQYLKKSSALMGVNNRIKLGTEADIIIAHRLMKEAFAVYRYKSNNSC